MMRNIFVSLCSICVLLLASAAHASSGIDTRGTNLPFNIEGSQIMTMTATGLGIHTSSPGEALDVNGIIRSNNEIISITGVSNIRMIGGNYGAMWRNDGANTYFLLTNQNDVYGAWNSLRPIYINDATGVVNFEQGLNSTSVNIGNSQNNANLCVNGKCTQTAFNPNTCHMVTNIGGPPNYISDARCGAGEFLLTGGGRVEVPGSDLCGGVTKGIMHYSAPDGDLMGWTVDGFNNTYSGEACTEAYAVCCTR